MATATGRVEVKMETNPSPPPPLIKTVILRRREEEGDLFFVGVDGDWWDLFKTNVGKTAVVTYTPGTPNVVTAATVK